MFNPWYRPHVSKRALRALLTGVPHARYRVCTGHGVLRDSVRVQGVYGAIWHLPRHPIQTLAEHALFSLYLVSVLSEPVNRALRARNPSFTLPRNVDNAPIRASLFY